MEFKKPLRQVNAPEIITNSIGIELSKPFKNLNTVTGVNEIINRIGYIRSFLE